MWNFKVYTKWDEIWSDKFLQKWNELLAKSDLNHVFFCPSVARAWVDTYLPLRKMTPLFIWGKKKESEKEVFLPLVLWSHNWRNALMKSIIPVGYSDYDYHDPLVSEMFDDKEKECFWNELIELLERKHTDEICIDGIRDSFTTSVALWEKGDICPCLSLDGMMDDSDLLKFLNTKLRGDVRRQIRRLNEVSELTFKEYAGYEEVPTKLFDEFLKIHSQRWPHAYKAPNFHRNLLKLCGLNGPVHFSTLNVGEVVVAWHLGFEYNGVYYYYMPAGNPEYQKYSPVKIHLYFLLCRAIKKGLVKYDHLRGDENYKSGWADGCVYVNTYRQYGDGLATHLKRNLLKVRTLITSIKC